MFTKAGQVAGLCIAVLAGVAANTAQAFDSTVDYEYVAGTVPGGGIADHCPSKWEAYFDDPGNADGGTHDVGVGISGSPFQVSGGEQWLNGQYRNDTGALVASNIDATCSNLSNTVIISQDGIDIDGTNASTAGVPAAFDSEAYIGVIFEADYTDGNRYRYELAFSGVSSTQFINTKVQVAVNTPPVANAGGDQTIAPGALVTLDGTGSSDGDSDPLTYSWSQTSGPGVTLSSNSDAQPTFTAPNLDGQTLVFTLTVSDGQDTSAGDSVIITTAAAQNADPTANAGPDQIVSSGATVTLTGAASTAPEPGQTLSYTWSQSSGDLVGLSSTSAESPTFTAPTLAIGDPAKVLVFSLIVNDGYESSVADTVQITVNPPANTPPTANAGLDQTVAPSTTVTLDGTGSNANDAGQTLTYTWSETSGTGITLSSTSAAQPTFTAPNLVIGDSDVVLTFSLTVNDGVVDSAADTVEITVSAPVNTPPIANAGPDQTVAPSSTVTLDGTGSDANDSGQTLTYTWSETSGTGITLSSTSAAQPTFTAPNLVIGDSDVVLTFSLTVNDGFDNSVADTVQITVTAPVNTAPVADAGGDQTVASAASVTLDGTGSSDGDSHPLTYTWSQSSGPTATLSDTSVASPTFTAPALNIGDPDVVLVFSLIVNDGYEDSTSDTVTITVQATPNTPPVADAGPDQTVDQGTSVTLDGTGSSDGDSHPLTYTWSQSSGPTATLSDTSVASPTFTAPALNIGDSDAVLVFSLIVNDGFTDSPADTVQITVSAPANTAPVANAGSDQIVDNNTLVTLDGTASSDGDSHPLTYAWSQSSGPTVSLSSTTAASPTFTAPTLTAADSDAALTFSLVVNDGFANSPADTVTITVSAPPDTTAPVIAPVADINTGTDGTSDTASVALAATVTDDVDGSVPPVFSIGGTPVSSPHTFPVGATVVAVDAEDSAGNTAVTQTFTVTVTDSTPPSDPSGLGYTILAGNAVQITGTANANSTVTVTFPDSTTATVPATGGSFSATSAAGMISGTATAVAEDAAGNTSATVSLAVSLDNTPPEVTIGGVPATFSGTTPFTATFAWSEDVSGFAQGDITVTGATLSGFASSAADSYSVTVTPTGGGDVTLSVPAAVAQDSAGNDNLASATVTAANTVGEETAAMLEDEAETRARNLIANQPNLAGFMLGRTGRFQLNATSRGGTFDFATGEQAVWFGLRGAWTNSDAGDGSYVLAATGAHIVSKEDFIAGLMVQFDRSETVDGSASIDTEGWLAGAYVVARPTDQPLILSASYLAGRSNVSVSPLGTYTDSFTSDRTLLTLGMTGEIELERLTLMPTLDLARTTEDQPAYVDGASNPVPARSIAVTEASVGLDFIMPLDVNQGALDLTGGISAIFSSTDVSGVVEQSTRGRIDLGLTHVADNGITTRLTGFTDGVGDDAFESFGAELIVEFEF